MCIAGMPGLVLGLASGAAQVAGQVQAANTNADIAAQQARLEQGSQEREYLIEANASAKEAYKVAQERDRAIAEAKTIGAEMSGSTASERVSEQGRQGALSIANARDRADTARANYVMSGHHSQIKAENDIRANAVNPLTSFINIATSGLEGYKSWSKPSGGYQ